MTVDKIIPCVCAAHPPISVINDSYGMPVLAPRNGSKPHQQYWSVYCPDCGRGSKLMDCRSAYMALQKWNEIQKTCYRIEDREIVFDAPYEPEGDHPEWLTFESNQWNDAPPARWLRKEK